MIGGMKTVNLKWVNRIAVIGCTLLFAYEIAFTYEGRMNAAPYIGSVCCAGEYSCAEHSTRRGGAVYARQTNVAARAGKMMIS